jgi:DNA-binding Lrp family transcriptional regulator
MRPTSQPQSALRAPLNHILGTEANVRVLRVLADLRTPIPPPELARRAQLQRSSVHRALKALEETGVVRFIGTIPSAQVALADHSPMAKAIRELFALERASFEELVKGIRKIAETLRNPPIAVWIEGPVARETDRPGDPVVIGVVDGPRTLSDTCEAIRRAAERVESKLDVTIEVRGRTLADIDTMPRRAAAELETAIPILGVPAAGLLARYGSIPERNIRMHGDHDLRARALGAEIAEAVKKDGTLVGRARAYVERRWREASPRERKELAEWRGILRTASPGRLRKILMDPGERATRLRQTLPFLGILTENAEP